MRVRERHTHTDRDRDRQTETERERERQNAKLSDERRRSNLWIEEQRQFLTPSVSTGLPKTT